MAGKVNTALLAQYMATLDKLTVIKILHTAIWVFFNIVIFYICFAVITNRINLLLWVCIGVILLEGFVLIFFKNSCPLTIIARRFSDSTSDNFDIYLPNWLAKYNKLIYTTIFVIAVIALCVRLIGSQA